MRQYHDLWHMRRPGPPTEVYRYNTVPKKVDGALYRPSGTVEDVVGYEVRINVRLNDVLILWWSFVLSWPPVSSYICTPGARVMTLRRLGWELT